MTVSAPEGTYPLPRIVKPDGTIEHVICEGSREHVTYWDTHGAHCSEPNCEMNKRESEAKE